MTVDRAAMPADDGFDLGASWVWPRAQRGISGVFEDLGVRTYSQQSDGDVVFERMSRETPSRCSPVAPDFSAVRVVGRAGAVAKALREQSGEGCELRLEATVNDLTLTPSGVRVGYRSPDGSGRTEYAGVILAIPPRLAAELIRFDPPLDPMDVERWRATPTWMAGQAKFIAVYDRPLLARCGSEWHRAESRGSHGGDSRCDAPRRTGSADGIHRCRSRPASIDGATRPRERMYRSAASHLRSRCRAPVEHHYQGLGKRHVHLDCAR